MTPRGRWSLLFLSTLPCVAGPDASARPVARRPPTLGAFEVVLGNAFACGRDEAGTVRCWGANERGERGDGASRGSDLSSPATAPVLTDAAQIVGGYHHACALRRDGTVACWGGGGYGQLGDGTLQDRARPTTVPGLSNVLRIAAGQFFTCALTTGGEVWCWGYNRWRVAANMATERVVSPTRVSELRGVTSLAAAGDHACARTGDGALWCWGSNDWGQLGVGRRGGFRRPTRVQGVGEVASVALGGTFSCVTRANGQVACWGQNLFSPTQTQIHPRPFVLTQIRALSELACGAEDLCGRSADGTVRCWGVNRYHQSAPRAQFAPDAPEEIQGLPPGVESLFVGPNAICVRGGEGRTRGLHCWGHNDHGQLGTGSNGDTTTPAKVRW
jgi:alpha-tubulin suppressor-like RCC1 family protein